MKNLILAAILTFSTSSFAYTLKSEDAEISAARVHSVVNLLNKQEGNGKNLVVNVVVKAYGGSTDVSPTQAVYLTMFAKGEMFSTDAAFKLADVWEFKSAKRVSAGIYEVSATVITDEGTFQDVTFVVDGKKASSEIQNVKCDDFDCDASTNFSTSVEVKVK